MADLPGHGFADDCVLRPLGRGAEVRNFGSGVFIPQLGAQSRDLVAPVIANMTPNPSLAPGLPGAFPASYSVARRTPIAFDVLDTAPGVRLLVVTVAFTFPGETEPSEVVAVFDSESSGGLRVGWRRGSTATMIEGGWHLSIVPDAGWPPGASVALDVRAVDAHGNLEGSAALASIEVLPNLPSLVVAATVQLTATATYSNGTHDDVTNTATWSSSAPAVATVNAAGLVTAVGAGTATITAQRGSVVGTEVVTVTAPVTLVSIAVTPASPTFIPTISADRLQLTATATYSNGSTGNVTATATWAVVVNPQVASVGNGVTAGQVTALSIGSVQIAASIGAVSGSTTVTVEIDADATKGWRLPASAYQWDLLAASVQAASSFAATAPANDWPGQITSGNLVDRIGGVDLVPQISPTPNVAVTGWSRVGIDLDEGSADRYIAGTGVGASPASNDLALLMVCRLEVEPTVARILLGWNLAAAGAARLQFLPISGNNILRAVCNGTTVNESTNADHSVGDYVFLVVYDRTNSRFVCYSNLAKVIGTYSAGVTDGEKGFGGNTSPELRFIHGAQWVGGGARFTDAGAKALIQLITKTAPPWS